MPTPFLSDEVLRETIAVWEQFRRQRTLAAESLGMSKSTFDKRLAVAQKRASEMGWHLSEGVQKQIQAVSISGAEVREGWIQVTDPETGRKIGNVHYAVPKLTEEENASRLETIRDAFADIIPAPPIIQSPHSQKGKIAFFPHTDVHIGVDVDADRAGRDYTPDIAVERLREGFSRVHASIPPCETAIILNNGDLTHANDDRDVTVKSQHRLKVRGSHRSNLRLATLATKWQIDMALQRSERVIYRPNRGNHDPNTPDTLSIALGIYYADNPRVTIDDSEREIWVYQQGKVFLAAWHGDKRRPQAVCGSLPGLFPEQWGASRHWHGFSGHYHEEQHAVHNSMDWWQLPSVCSLDQYSADAGFNNSAAMRAMMFCENEGLRDNIRIAL